MPYSNHFGRKRLRWREHDYRASAAYMITVCTRERKPILSRIEHGRVWLSAAGEIVIEEWLAGAVIRPNVRLDAFVLMPDHMHAIVRIGQTLNPTAIAPPASLSTLMQQFKSVTTRRVNELQKSPGVQLWQRSYHDRIIRDGLGLTMMRKYIRDNPARWLPPSPTGEGGQVKGWP
ncbi:MAG: transposase [Gemmatimonadota bacterium]